MNMGLSEQQLDELEAFLFQHMEKESCLPLDAAHGFLTAVVSGPRMILPGEWLPRVLGKIDFSSTEEAQQITTLLMSLYNSTIDELERDDYVPVILTLGDETNEEPLPLPYGWCEGYIMGWNLHGEGVFDTMAQDEESARMLGPVVAFLMYEEEQLLNPPDEKEHRATAAALSASAVSLYNWWLSRREMPMGTA